MSSYFVFTKFSNQLNTAENSSNSNKQASGIVLTASVLTCVVVLNHFFQIDEVFEHHFMYWSTNRKINSRVVHFLYVGINLHHFSFCFKQKLHNMHSMVSLDCLIGVNLRITEGNMASSAPFFLFFGIEVVAYRCSLNVI